MTDFDSSELSSTDDFSIKQLIDQAKQWFFLLLRNWYIIGILGIAFGLVGFFYAKTRAVQYSAKTSFVVEETKTANSGLSSLAGQLGFDFSVGAGGSLLTGENLLVFLKSKGLCKEVLLTPAEPGKNESLADLYMSVYNFNDAFKKNKEINGSITFPVNATKPNTRIQDSILQIIVENITSKQIVVERPEKKASFVTVEVLSKSELFSSLFCKKLLERAVERYITSKTKRQKTNVDRLQRRADSIEAVLNNRTYTNASQQEELLDLNPAAKTQSVAAELSSRDKMMLMTVYGEVMKNLEVSKVQLNQETPTIQVVDNVELPLKIVKKSKLKFLIIGGFIGFFLSVAIIIVRNLIKPQAAKLK